MSTLCCSTSRIVRPGCGAATGAVAWLPSLPHRCGLRAMRSPSPPCGTLHSCMRGGAAPLPGPCRMSAQATPRSGGGRPWRPSLRRGQGRGGWALSLAAGGRGYRMSTMGIAHDRPEERSGGMGTEPGCPGFGFGRFSVGPALISVAESMSVVPTRSAGARMER